MAEAKFPWAGDRPLQTAVGLLKWRGWDDTQIHQLCDTVAALIERVKKESHREADIELGLVDQLRNPPPVQAVLSPLKKPLVWGRFNQIDRGQIRHQIADDSLGLYILLRQKGLGATQTQLPEQVPGTQLRPEELMAGMILRYAQQNNKGNAVTWRIPYWKNISQLGTWTLSRRECTRGKILPLDEAADGNCVNSVKDGPRHLPP